MMSDNDCKDPACRCRTMSPHHWFDKARAAHRDVRRLNEEADSLRAQNTSLKNEMQRLVLATEKTA